MGKSNLLLIFVALGLVWAGMTMIGLVTEPAKSIAGQPDWELPVTAGVWYPQNGPLPEKPMRYYRVRCWPGCHSGSSLGMYSDTPLLGDRPLHYTSTIDNLPAGHPVLTKSDANTD